MGEAEGLMLSTHPSAQSAATTSGSDVTGTGGRTARPESVRGTIDLECGIEPISKYLATMKNSLAGLQVVTATISPTSETRTVVDRGDPEMPENLVYTRVHLTEVTPIAGLAKPDLSSAWIRGGIAGSVVYRYAQAVYAWAEDGRAVVVLSKQADGETYVGGVFPLVGDQILLDLSCVTSEGTAVGRGHFTGEIEVAYDGRATLESVDVGSISLPEFSRRLNS
ncbi:hypothetical protein D1871_12285 [Nakamurella silvestris]|nr:hypothetical protein D1871_12285 [Nakamurella silvestris]